MGVVIFSVKMVAASAVVLSSAVALRLATPTVTKFLGAEAPRLCDSVSAWLTPFYLYFIVNGIIISIAATSRFRKPNTASDNLGLDPTLSDPPPTISAYDNPTENENVSSVSGDGNSLPEFFVSDISTDKVMDLSVPVADTDLGEGFVISRSILSPMRGSSEDLPEKLAVAGAEGATMERLPVSTRLNRRRSIKTNPEASKSLRVSRPKKNDTLESTWKAITDGRHVPIGRHLKKLDTWDTNTRAIAVDPAPPLPVILKSETFSGRSTPTTGLPSPSSRSGASFPAEGKLRREPSVGKLRRESSVGQDDLNRRVEAFIKKFNAEMRLQRQNSLQQYMDMINCSSY